MQYWQAGTVTVVVAAAAELLLLLQGCMAKGELQQQLRELGVRRPALHDDKSHGRAELGNESSVRRAP
jgi:hypothetical protein